MDGCFAVEGMGLSGGIALLWKERWKVQVINFTRWHISALVQEEESGPSWQFTCFYGHPETGKRSSSWQLLKMLKPANTMAWLVAGDFNEILHQKEKVGGASRPYKQIEDFKQAIEFCGLNDIHSLGLYFTWSNNIFGREFTKEKLDRALGNKEWSDLFTHGSSTALAAIKSDHSPLVIDTYSVRQEIRRRRKCFRYEMAWELKEECQKVISDAWKKGYGTGCEASLMRNKLKACQQELLAWKQKSKQMEGRDIIQGLQRIGHLQDTGTGDHVATLRRTQEQVVASMT